MTKNAGRHDSPLQPSDEELYHRWCRAKGEDPEDPGGYFRHLVSPGKHRSDFGESIGGVGGEDIASWNPDEDVFDP